MLLMAEEYSSVYIGHIFFVHSSPDGHLGFCHVLAVINSAAMNTGVYVSFQIIVFSRYLLRNEIAGSYGNSLFSFMLFSIVTAPIYIPPSSAEGFPFLDTLPSICYFWTF